MIYISFSVGFISEKLEEVVVVKILQPEFAALRTMRLREMLNVAAFSVCLQMHSCIQDHLCGSFSLMFQRGYETEARFDFSSSHYNTILPEIWRDVEEKTFK